MKHTLSLAVSHKPCTIEYIHHWLSIVHEQLHSLCLIQCTWWLSCARQGAWRHSVQAETLSLLSFQVAQFVVYCCLQSMVQCQRTSCPPQRVVLRSATENRLCFLGLHMPHHILSKCRNNVLSWNTIYSKEKASWPLRSHHMCPYLSIMWCTHKSFTIPKTLHNIR